MGGVGEASNQIGLPTKRIDGNSLSHLDENARVPPSIEVRAVSKGILLANQSRNLKVTRRRLGFLSTKVLPVDAYKMRNSLYLTQLLRSPAQAAINVIMREDLPKMRQQSIYRSMEGQSDRLYREFKQSMNDMASELPQDA